MPARIRHCACLHLPARADQLLDLLKPARLTEAQQDRITELLYDSPAQPHHHDRALSHVSAPDGWGHVYWTGHIPKRQGPHVQYQGKRIPVKHWLWLRAGRPGVFPLVRTCHDPQCIAPRHHSLARAPTGDLTLMHAALEEFDRDHPRINYRPKRWDNSDPRGERCYRDATHKFTVYGDPRLRNSYCAGCFRLEKARLAEREVILRRIERATSDSAPVYGIDRRAGSPEPEPLPVDSIPDGPTLVDQILAWSPEDFEPHATG